MAIEGYVSPNTTHHRRLRNLETLGWCFEKVPENELEIQNQSMRYQFELGYRFCATYHAVKGKGYVTFATSQTLTLLIDQVYTYATESGQLRDESPKAYLGR